DELTAYYSRTMGAVGGWDIYVATRAHRTDPFGDGMVLDALDSATANDIASSVSSDGLALYFYSDRKRTAAGAWQIYVATRTDPNAAFTSFGLVDALNGGTTTSQDEEAFISATGDAIYFASLRSANGDIYTSPISGGVVGMPVKVPAVNSAD